MSKLPFKTQIEAIAEVLHTLSKGEEVTEGVLEKTVGEVDLRISEDVIELLNESYQDPAKRIFGMSINAKGVIDRAIDVTGDNWSPMGAYTNSGHSELKYHGNGNYFLGQCHLMSGDLGYTIEAGDADTAGLPMPHYLTAALAANIGAKEPLVFTGLKKEENVEIRAFLSAFSRMGGLIVPNSRADILGYRKIATDDKIRELGKQKEIMVIRSNKNPLLHGGVIEIPYETV